ncbi:hypothetical protein DID88_004936 [Monilinia fructigena]|uniref:Uncharacterized protein n=1 Tax=Monilinia fructigena TaxID=38457 RepID=A0A395IQ02_9HELO|nr:hypothetical protein DID88_004936 [Monilinia fructigena]
MSLPSGLDPGKAGKNDGRIILGKEFPDTPLAKVTCEEIEGLQNTLFRLTSDHQRLYGVFMPNGEASSNTTTIWKLSDINLPFLFGIRQQLVNLQAATKVFESGEKLKDDQAFFESQRTLYNSLVEVVASAIERLTWLRRELEGVNGYAYQYSSWYYQVIGNNPRSTDTSSANVDGKGEREDPKSYKAHSQACGDDGSLVSPVTDSDDDREERPKKRQKT